MSQGGLDAAPSLSINVILSIQDQMQLLWQCLEDIL
jgi:hypothetical protein